MIALRRANSSSAPGLCPVFCAIGPAYRQQPENCVPYVLDQEVDRGVSLVVLTPALINSIVTCWPDLVAISRFDCAGSL